MFIRMILVIVGGTTKLAPSSILTHPPYIGVPSVKFDMISFI